MRFQYLRYLFKTIIMRIPAAQWLAAAELCILIVIVGREILALRRRDRHRLVFSGILAGYLYIVLTSLVLARPTRAVYTYQLHFLWSYVKILQGFRVNLWENVLNVLLFVPAGFLARMIMPRWKVRHAALFGLAVSIVLEVLQLVLRRGLFEFDDMLNNAVGAALGAMCYWGRFSMTHYRKC